jgi:hypothetical protein
VGGDVVVDAGAGGDAADDDVAGALDAQAPAALVEQQCRVVVGAGPAGALIEPACERSA